MIRCPSVAFKGLALDSVSKTRFCVLEKRRLAFIPGHSQRGDRVSVVLGILTPFTSKKGAREFYSIIRRAYVEGIITVKLSMCKSLLCKIYKTTVVSSHLNEL